LTSPLFAYWTSGASTATVSAALAVCATSERVELIDRCANRGGTDLLLPKALSLRLGSSSKAET
jgi:hypothetical protein